MSTSLNDLAELLTARKGNHPALWLLFGGVTLTAGVLSVVKKETFVPIPRLWRALHGMPAKRFEEVGFASEPTLFVIVVIVLLFFSAFCVSVGVVSLRLRGKARRESHRFADIVSR